MTPSRVSRILIVTDVAAPSPELMAAVHHRRDQGPAQFRVVVPNPARAELHLLHPERHDKAREAEHVLHRALEVLELAAGGRVIGSVSVRHDPMDAVEEVLFSEPIDEIMLHLAPHGLAARLHQDLRHRLQHFGLPILVVPHRDVTPRDAVPGPSRGPSQGPSQGPRQGPRQGPVRGTERDDLLRNVGPGKKVPGISDGCHRSG